MKKFIEKSHVDSCIESIINVVSTPSVLEENSTSKFPFGENIQKCLVDTLEICKSLGMKTFIDEEGYYGYAEIGEGAETFGVLCHLDVVPPGDLSKWNSNPFEAKVTDGRIYGRGTQDDKGPTIAALYSLKSVIDSGEAFRRKIRFIFGTDEENLWRCMSKYAQKEVFPDLGIAPDSDFPLTYAESAVLQVKLTSKGNSSLKIKSGDAFNIVPEKAYYSGDKLDKIEEKLLEKKFEFAKVDSGVEVVGISCHAMKAEEGINAITRLSIVLNESNISSKAIDFIASVGEDAFAQNVFGKVEDDVSGKLKFNIGKLNIDEVSEEICIDMRIPVTLDKQEIVTKLKDYASNFDLEYNEYDYLAPLYVPKDSELVKELMSVYHDKTGDVTLEPKTSGGATYARTMKNCVAFGMMFPSSKQTEHQPNEYIVIEELEKAMEIYAEMFSRLCFKR